MKKLSKIILKETTLSPDEMKKIRGGLMIECERMDSYGVRHTFMTGSDKVATAWCDVWHGFGQACDCRLYKKEGYYYV